MPRRSAGSQPSERGFTVLELMIVVSLMGILLALASDALISMTNTTSRHGAMVDAEQTTSTAMTQLTTDIRSAHSIQFPANPPPSSAVILNLNNPAGGAMTQVEWLYQSGPGTLVRQILNPATGSVVSALTVATTVTNGSLPMFTYFNYHGTDVTASDPGTVANCTTRIVVQLKVGPTTTGVSAFSESADAALTDQLALLSQPGNGQC